MTAHSKITTGHPAARALTPSKTAADVARDREDAKAAARARRELQSETFDGVSLDALEASLTKRS